MDTSEIQARLDVLPALMTAKGLRRPEVSYTLKGNQESDCYIRWHKIEKDDQSDSEYKFFYGRDPSKIIEKAEAYINTLPSSEDIKRDAFLAALGRVIDYGNELGQDVGALVREMHRISTNAITDQRPKTGHG